MSDSTPLHLVWDWNGTVLNDFAIILRATNDSFRDAGLPLITADETRARNLVPAARVAARIGDCGSARLVKFIRTETLMDVD